MCSSIPPYRTNIASPPQLSTARVCYTSNISSISGCQPQYERQLYQEILRSGPCCQLLHGLAIISDAENDNQVDVISSKETHKGLALPSAFSSGPAWLWSTRLNIHGLCSQGFPQPRAEFLLDTPPARQNRKSHGERETCTSVNGLSPPKQLARESGEKGRQS